MSSSRPTKAERIWRYQECPPADVAVMLANAFDEFERIRTELAHEPHEHTASCAGVFHGCPTQLLAEFADDIQELRASLRDHAEILAMVDRPQVFEASEAIRTRDVTGQPVRPAGE